MSRTPRTASAGRPRDQDGARSARAEDVPDPLLAAQEILQHRRSEDLFEQPFDHAPQRPNGAVSQVHAGGPLPGEPAAVVRRVKLAAEGPQNLEDADLGRR